MLLPLGSRTKRISLLCVTLAIVAALPAAAERGPYRNEKFGYAISYPPGWFPSRIRYGNAFELRNYDPELAPSVAEKNRASVIFVDAVNEDAGVTGRYVDSLKAEKPFRVKRFVLSGRRGVRVPRTMPSQPLGRGARGPGGAEPKTSWFLADGVYIANGVHLLSVETRVPVEADRKVVKEIDRILKGVKFFRDPPRSGGTR